MDIIFKNGIKRGRITVPIQNARKKNCFLNVMELIQGIYIVHQSNQHYTRIPW